MSGTSQQTINNKKAQSAFFANCAFLVAEARPFLILSYFSAYSLSDCYRLIFVRFSFLLSRFCPGTNEKKYDFFFTFLLSCNLSLKGSYSTYTASAHPAQSSFWACIFFSSSICFWTVWLNF